MNNDTKNTLMGSTDLSDLTSGNACWETPPLVFAKLNEDFGPFDVDLTADAQRHLCQIWFGPGSHTEFQDALTAPWYGPGRMSGFSNPPYGPFIQRLLSKAKQETVNGFTSTLLLPLRITKAFKEHVLIGASGLYLCDRRLTFFENGVPRLNEAMYGKRGKKGQILKARTDPAVFDSIIVRYHPGTTSLHVGIWEVPKHVTAVDVERAVERRAALLLATA